MPQLGPMHVHLCRYDRSVIGQLLLGLEQCDALTEPHRGGVQLDGSSKIYSVRGEQAVSFS